ncbi:MAG: hypothetical protein K2O41_07100, partial [Clostridia bacterium]|nr:hypothetical protein [Clostridia bacterium]
MVNNFKSHMRCVLTVLYIEKYCAEILIEKLSGMGFENLKIHKSKRSKEFYVNLIANTKQDVGSIDEAIYENFSAISNKLDELKKIVIQTKGKFFIDIFTNKNVALPVINLR